MSMNITFDTANNPEAPTLILATRSGKKLGQLNAENIVCNDSLKEASELSFRVRKYLNGKKNILWNKLVDFKLVWCKNYNTWFQITVDIDESNETIKNVLGIRLGEAELSQIMLYDVEINTEDDIARDDYKATVLFDKDDKSASLLHRIMEKAPHYSVIHVDATIKNIQRTFTFDNISIYDAMQEIGEEIGCLFIFNSNSDEDDNIQRTISVYDIQSYCYECGHRGNFTLNCPKCHSENIYEGYGDDTTIFITSDELGEDIQFTTDTGAVKNCFKLEAGDDLMTATIRNCNPNGSDYIWYLSNDMKADMSEDLINKLSNYDKDYTYYQAEYPINISSTLVSEYNKLVNNYKKNFNANLETLPNQIKGYPALMNALYNTIDFRLYLQSGLMPNVSLSDTSATQQAALLTVSNLSPVSVESTKNISLATANSAILLMAKVLVDSRYQIKVNTSNLTGLKWTGNFIITNYSDEEDNAISDTITITINDNYETFVKQKIEKALSKDGNYDTSISGLFKMDDDPDKTDTPFKKEIKKYCLNRLTAFYDSCQACINILIEQGIADRESWNASDGNDPDKNLYDDLYLPYHTKLASLESEIKQREKETKQVTDIIDTLQRTQQEIQRILNFEKYLGKDSWMEFCAYRREDTYSNNNYISDGLSDSEVFNRANEFIKLAKEEIFKSAELQHSISSKLKNLLVIQKFKPLVDMFKVGNWIRIQIDDVIYKLRLLFYEINFDDIEDLNVEFSDITKTVNGLTDQKALMQKASSMATSYDSTKKQAEQGKKSKEQLNNWVDKGLSLTNIKIVSNANNQNQTWDEHGILCREYSPITDTYNDRQLKIINRGLYVTDDNWKTAKAGIGNFTFWNPETQETENRYGVIADTLVGNLVLSEKVGIYNQNNSIQLNENGINIAGQKNTVTINPNNSSVFTIKKNQSNKQIIGFDEDGNIAITGSFYSGDNQEVKINSNGTFNFGNGKFVYDGNIISFEGEISANSGKIGGWTVSSDRIYNKGGEYYTVLSAFDSESSNAPILYCQKGNGDDRTFPLQILRNGNIWIGENALNRLLLKEGHIDFYVGNKHSGRLGQNENNDITIENTNLSCEKDIYCDGGIYGRTGFSEDGYYSACLVKYTIQNNEFLIGLGDGTKRDSINLYSNHNLRFPNNYGISLNGGSIAFRYYNNAVYCGIDTKPLKLVGSSITSNGSSVTSDIRMKNNINNISTKYLELLNLLEAKTYKFNNHNPDVTNTGFIAQEVLSALKQLGLSPKDFGGFVDIYGDGSEYALDYTQFIAILWKAVQNINQKLIKMEQESEDK